MSRTTPATCRSSEPPPPTTVALDPVVTPSDCAAPRSTRTALASAAGHAPPDTARLPTSGGVAGPGPVAARRPLPPPPTTPDPAMWIGVSPPTREQMAAHPYRPGAGASAVRPP